MRQIAGAVLVGMIFMVASGFREKPEASLDGRWFGEYQVQSGNVDFEVRFWTEEGQLKGSIDIPHEGIFEAELAWIMIDSTSIHFELVSGGTTRVFDGQMRENQLQGLYLNNQEKGSFSMSRGGLVSQ